MEDDKKYKMSKFQLVISIIILLILISFLVFAFFKQKDEKNKILDNSQSLSTESKENDDTETNSEIKSEVGTEIKLSDEIVQKIIPLTGAFPSNDFRYIANIKQIDKKNLTNDFILKFAWSKVRKEDWQNSYTGETSAVSIDASVLDKYIKDIFGNIEYQNANFSNKDLVMAGSDTSLYDIIYDKPSDKYYIQFEAGDGVEDSFIIDNLYSKAMKYSDRIEITLHPIYVKNCGEMLGKDGIYHFSYVAYQHYNFETKSFVGRLTDTLENVYEENAEEPKYSQAILDIKEKDLEKYKITYMLNKTTGNYEFYSLKYEQ